MGEKRWGTAFGGGPEVAQIREKNERPADFLTLNQRVLGSSPSASTTLSA